MFFRKKIVYPLGLTGLGFLGVDFYHHPKNNCEALKSKKIFFIADKLNQIKKFTPQELSEKELKVRKGKIYQGDSAQPVTSSNLIYILDKSGKIYFTEQKRRMINHTSMGWLCNVITAGEMIVINGEVFLLNPKSGHYRPKDERLTLMEHRLKELGATFHPAYECKPISMGYR